MLLPELDGLGVFAPTGSTPRLDIGRISNGLGCPHAETDADFRGPGVVNMLANQARLIGGLLRHAGHRAPAIATQVIRQTSRTQHSSTAYQQYWTGVVRARDVLGKFTFVPVTNDNGPRPAGAGEHYLTDDWSHRQQGGPLEFWLYWAPYIDEASTPLQDLTRGWREDHRALVGTVSFEAADPAAMETKLVSLLASEMGANQGNWIEDDRGGAASDLPATEYTAARFLAYRVSQRMRNALPEALYASFFEHGVVEPALATELLRRYQQKRAAGHGQPDLGAVTIA